MNKAIVSVVIILLILGGAYFTLKQIKRSQQMQEQNAMYQNQQSQITSTPSQSDIFDDQTSLQQDLVDDQYLNQISMDDTADDSALTDTSGL